MDRKTIDLDQAEQAISSLFTNNCNIQERYQPKTLQGYHSPRCDYLPLFPTKAFGPNNYLLLANVPITHLTLLERLRRQHGAYTTDALKLVDDYKFSFLDEFPLSKHDAQKLATRLRVGLSIITFNAIRLRSHCYYLLLLHQAFRRSYLPRKRQVRVRGEPGFNSKQMALALEFYLQIDVDIFYMKTCSFRGAEPQSNCEGGGGGGGLFCGTDEPQARYKLTACDNQSCLCCHPINSSRRSQTWPVINFDSSSTHQFLNGYTTYLNCPATCQTSNIIYTMTCPCGEYDFVDSTTEILAEPMAYHREHGNRIIHEKLTGFRFRGLQLDPNEIEKEFANQMRLYQHSARCPVALRAFLDCNPNYWCFIPQPWRDAAAENVRYIQRRPEQKARTSNTTMDVEEQQSFDEVIMMGTIDNPRVAYYFDRVPLPPTAYAFSYRQRREQRLFFEKIVLSRSSSSLIQSLLYSSLDLYQIAIITVLPNDCSHILRYIIQTLLTIHAETKLNMICPIEGDPEKRYGRPFRFDWCNGLNTYRPTSTDAASSSST